MASTIRGSDNFDSGQTLTLMVSQPTTSGTYIDFTGIPSWAKRVTVMFNGVSTSGTAQLMVQIGSGSISTSGYTSSATDNGGITNFSGNAFGVLKAGNAGWIFSGHCTITAVGGNAYVQSGVLASNGTQTASTSGGIVALSGVMDRIRITTTNGTDTFDAGSVNVLYE